MSPSPQAHHRAEPQAAPRRPRRGEAIDSSPLAYRNQAVQRLRRLAARRADREREGCFVVEGTKAVAEALAAGAEVELVLVDSGSDTAAWQALATEAELARVSVRTVEPGVLRRACDTKSPQPVAAVVRRRAHSLDGLKANLSVSGGLVLVLVGVNDPANMGALVRVAGALGEAAVLCCTGSADPYGPKAVRASAGALFRVPVLTGIDPEEVLCELGRWGVWRWATVPRGGVPPNEVNLSVPTALVFGNEAHGIPEVLQRYLDGAVTVPIAPDAESLNVAVAAGIICYEAACQRGGLEPQPQRRGRP